MMRFSVPGFGGFHWYLKKKRNGGAMARALTRHHRNHQNLGMGCVAGFQWF
jgi:hypothetical protein